MSRSADTAGEAPAYAAELPGDWDDLVRSCPAAEYTQTSHWLRCVARHYPGAQLAVLTVRRDGRLVAGLAAVALASGPLRRLDSGLEGTAGGPLVAGDLDPADQDRLFLAVVDAYAGLRRGPRTALGMALAPLREERFGPVLRGRKPWRRHDSPTAVISLEGGLETVERERLKKNKRNERNRGLRRGVTVFATTDPVWLERYYPLYLRAAGHWGIRPVPEPFIRDLLQGPPGEGPGQAFLTCAVLSDEVIGAHLNLHLGERVFAWSGVTDPRYARTHFPSTVCLWGDLEEACRRGARWLDIGASDVAASLLNFKRFFGAELQQRGYYTSEGILVRLARRARRLLKAGDRGGSRWHDRASGKS